MKIMRTVRCQAGEDTKQLSGSEEMAALDALKKNTKIWCKITGESTRISEKIAGTAKSRRIQTANDFAGRRCGCGCIFGIIGIYGNITVEVYLSDSASVDMIIRNMQSSAEG